MEKREASLRIPEPIVYADGAFSRTARRDWETGKGGRQTRCAGCCSQPDHFSHEQSLVLDTPRPAIFNSCSHGGADNIIAETADAFPQKHSYALIGGTSSASLRRSGGARAGSSRIRSTGIARVITGHRTGKRAYAILYDKLGSRWSRCMRAWRFGVGRNV